MELQRCPDCGHLVGEHDMYGCARVECAGRSTCQLTGEFLIEYFKADAL